MISRAMKWFTEVVRKYWLNRLVWLNFLCLFGSSVWISQSLKFFLERFLSSVLRPKSGTERLPFAGIFCKNWNCHHLIGLCLTGLSASLIPGDESAFETRQRASPAAFAGPSLLPLLLIYNCFLNQRRWQSFIAAGLVLSWIVFRNAVHSPVLLQLY